MCQIIAAVDILVRFRPGSNESTPGGWIVAAGYFVTSWLCRRTGRQELRLKQMGFERLRPRCWLFICYCLAFLGINQLLGLDDLLTVLGRQFAAQGGWYIVRRPVQVVLISATCMIGLMVLAVGLAYVKGQWRRYALAWIGTMALIGFVAVRAVSLHFIDELINYRWGIISINRACEVCGIAVVALAAYKAAAFNLTTDVMPLLTASEDPQDARRSEHRPSIRKSHEGLKVKIDVAGEKADWT